jgi:hypothetical protein
MSWQRKLLFLTLTLPLATASCQSSGGLTSEEQEALAVDLVRQRVGPVVSSVETARNAEWQRSSDMFVQAGADPMPPDSFMHFDVVYTAEQIGSGKYTVSVRVTARCPGITCAESWWVADPTNSGLGETICNELPGQFLVQVRDQVVIAQDDCAMFLTSTRTE